MQLCRFLVNLMDIFSFIESVPELKRVNKVVKSKMWKFLIFLILLRPSNGALEDFPMPDYGSALSEAVVDIIFNYYMNETLTINMIHASTNSEGREELEDLIDEILYQLRSKIIVQLEGDSNVAPSKRKKWYNILFCDTFESFENIFKQHSLEFQGFYLIIMSQTIGEVSHYKLMTRIFEFLWVKHVINVNVLLVPGENKYEALMYTYYPFTDFYCGKAFPIKLNQFRFGKWLLDTEIFPNKMSNLFGCPLRVATFMNKPFMIIHDYGNNHVEIDGIDGILLRVLAQKMNFNVELFLVNDLMWGDVYNNGTSTGDIQNN